MVEESQPRCHVAPSSAALEVPSQVTSLITIGTVETQESDQATQVQVCFNG